MHDKTYAQYVEQAQLYKQIGQTDVRLGYVKREDLDSLPWHLVRHIEEGAAHRLEIATSIHFRANDPCGLTFSWFVDMEPYEANGSNYYQLSVSTIEQIRQRITDIVARSEFDAYLSECLASMRNKLSEWQAAVERQERDIRSLSAVLSGGVHDPRLPQTAAEFIENNTGTHDVMTGKATNDI